MKGEHQYRMLAQNINDVIWTVDRNLRLTYVSPSVYRLLGYTADELIGEPLFAGLKPDSKRNARREVEQVKKRLAENNGRPFDLPLIENELVHKNGNPIWVEVKISFLTDGNGSISGLIGVTRDITERRQVEKQLKESEQRYRLLADNATDIIWVMDLSTLTLDYVSPSVERIRGFTPAEARNLSIEQHLSPESYQKVIAVLNEELSNDEREGVDKNRSVTMEVQELHKNGGYAWVELSASFVRDDSGKPIAIMGATRDIEARKEAEAVIIESEKKYRQLVKYAPTGLYEVDFIERKIVTVNDVVCEYSGYRKDEMLGMDPADLLTEESKQLFLERLQRMLAGEKVPLNVEYQIKKKNGDYLWVSLNVSLKHEGGRIKGATVVVHDITARKLSEDKLKKAHQELERKVKERTAELSDINRQLRTEIAERKQIEAALKESEQKFRAIFENMQDVFIRTDLDGKIVLISPSAADYYGVDSVDELLEKNFAQEFYYSARDRDKIIADILRNGVVKNVEVVFKRKDGTPITGEVNAYLVSDEQGNPIGIEAIARDLTERKAAEKELRENEAHLRSLMESATNFAVFRLAFDKQNPDLIRVVFVSPSITDIMRVSDPMVFRSWFENVHPDDRVKVVDGNRRAYETLKFNEILRCRHPFKEEWRWLHTVFTGVAGSKGRLAYANGILIDVTERERAERALAEKTINLEEVNTALKVLLKKRDSDRVEVEENVLLNVKELLEPYLAKLKKSGLNSRQTTLVEVLESNLQDMVSPFTHKLSSKLYNLSPAEIQVSNFIKHGKNTKEIASLLHLSPKTIKNHRGNIRKKLDLANKKVNLRAYLISLDHKAYFK